MSEAQKERQTRRDLRKLLRQQRENGTAIVEDGSTVEAVDTRTGVEVLEATIARAVEADTMANGTLLSLERQREQMLRIDDDLFTINNTLQNCERTLKSMGSIRGMLANRVKPPPSQTVETRYGQTEKDGDADPRLEKRPRPDPPVPMPATVLGKADIDTQDIKGKLAAKDILMRAKGDNAAGRTGTGRIEETLQFHYCNSVLATFMIRDVTDNCLVMSNQRFLRIENGKLLQALELGDLLAVAVVAGGMLGGRGSKLALTFNKHDETAYGGEGGGAPEKIEIAFGSADVSHFFHEMLKRVLRDLHERRQTRVLDDTEAPGEGYGGETWGGHVTHGKSSDRARAPSGASSGRGVSKRSTARSARDQKVVRGKVGQGELRESAAMDALEGEREEEMEQTDKLLDDLSGLVQGLGQKARAMGGELDRQSRIIHHLDDTIDSTQIRMNNAEGKVNKILKKSR